MHPTVKWHVSPATVARYWRLSLAIGMAVIGVVALLLSVLTRTVDRIEAGAAEIWRVGKLIANNTVHIPLLMRTNRIAADIVGAAEGIERATARISQSVASDGTGKETGIGT